MKILVILLLFQTAEEHETKNYRILGEKVDVKDVGRMLEGLHQDLKKHFGRAPRSKLRIEVYGTRERWQDALRKDGVTPPNAGGYYSPKTKKGYLYVQPSEYYTRQLILHEATHQFHYLAATNNNSPSCFWYTEGLAEYFGMHNWDGETLETGVIPAVTLEDYPRKALENFDTKLKKNLEGLISGKVACERPEAWGLIHFLINKDARRFKALAKLLDKAQDPLKSWQRVFGRVTPQVMKLYRDWVVAHQQPWRIVWTSWQERGKAIEGRSGSNGIAVLKKAQKRLSVELQKKKGRYQGGLIFGFKDAKNFHILQILDGGGCRIQRYKDGRWSTLNSKARPKVEGPDVLTLIQTDKGVRTEVNGQEMGTYAVDGNFGLNVESGTLHFTVKK